VPICSSSSLCVVLDSPSLLLLYLFSTSSLLPLVVLYMNLVFAHMLVVIPLRGREFSAHTCKGNCLSHHEVMTGFGENGSKFQCSMGVTQRIGIFLPPQ